MRMSKNIISDIFHMLKTKGANLQYGNEDVTQLEHALQCAELAEKNNFSFPAYSQNNNPKIRHYHHHHSALWSF